MACDHLIPFLLYLRMLFHLTMVTCFSQRDATALDEAWRVCEHYFKSWHTMQDLSQLSVIWIQPVVCDSQVLRVTLSHRLGRGISGNWTRKSLSTTAWKTKVGVSDVCNYRHSEDILVISFNSFEDFIIWMRPSAFPDFRKIFRRLNRTEHWFQHGLPAGNYTFTINYRKLRRSDIGFLPLFFLYEPLLCMFLQKLSYRWVDNEILGERTALRTWADRNCHTELI